MDETARSSFPHAPPRREGKDASSRLSEPLPAVCAPISVGFTSETFTFLYCFVDLHKEDNGDVSKGSLIRVA